MLSLRAQQQTLAQSHATPLLVLYSDASHTTYHTGVDAGYFQRVEEIKSFVESFHRQTHASAILASSVSFAHSAGSRGGGANDTNTITEAGDGHRGSGSGSVVQFDRMRFMNVFDWAPLTVTSMREGWLAQAVDHRYHVPVIVFVHM